MLVTKYRHTFVYKLDGISMNRIDGEVEVIEDSATGLLAVVTSDPDDYCLEGNRYNATAPGEIPRSQRRRFILVRLGLCTAAPSDGSESTTSLTVR